MAHLKRLLPKRSFQFTPTNFWPQDFRLSIRSKTFGFVGWKLCTTHVSFESDIQAKHVVSWAGDRVNQLTDKEPEVSIDSRLRQNA